jgi:protein-S-isoprenylcysteine O-methyltransferase Ste14
LSALVKIFVGTLIFVGIPIVSWGISDIKTYFDNDYRLIYSIVVILFQIILVSKYPQIGSNRGGGKDTIKRQHFVVIILQIVPMLILIIAEYSDSNKLLTIAESNIIRTVGLLTFLIGFTLTNWSEIILDKQFSVEVTIQENHELIKHGPFKYLRHPRYLGIIMFTLGICLIFNSCLALFLEVLLVITLLWRIIDEEKLMSTEFGEEWKFYKKSTWKLLPFIY